MLGSLLDLWFLLGFRFLRRFGSRLGSWHGLALLETTELFLGWGLGRCDIDFDLCDFGFAFLGRWFLGCGFAFWHLCLAINFSSGWF
jgi:hypothetical protein